MKKEDIEDLSSVSHRELYISNSHYHHHAFEILSTHKNIRDKLFKSFESKIPISPIIRSNKKKKKKGIKADSLNKEIRTLLKNKLKHEVKFEVNEEKGVFYFSNGKNTIGGFDFAILNHEKNISSLRNLCYGELHYHEGDKRWNQFLKKNHDLLEIANKLEKKDKLGIDIEYEHENEKFPLIVGEIQFGNWALVYRDFFKVLKANVQNSIDLLVYVVPTGDLELMLSNSIVTYKNTVKILDDFSKVISVPIWVIGIDIK